MEKSHDELQRLLYEHFYTNDGFGCFCGVEACDPEEWSIHVAGLIAPIEATITNSQTGESYTLTPE